MLNLQILSKLKILKSQALKLHVYDGFSREIIDKGENSILAKVVEFYQLKKKSII